ncbi:MAG TPA: hypothetical protein VMT28_05465 [Terriglobales bacterium]|jgi:hypothetical protein|nr:hypothetical protein [Terriglobales bacterium]
MKFARHLALLATLSLLVPLSALAKDRNQGSMQLTQAAQIGSTQLSPGDYTVKWTGSGPAVHVSIMQHNKAVAAASGTIVDQKRPAPYDDVVLKPVANSKQMRIEEIDFANRKEALRLKAS